MGLRDSRGEVSKQINCFDFQLECLTKSKNISLHRQIGHNHLIVLIDGYDETVHRGPFQLSRGRSILVNDQDEALDMKTPSIASFESRSDSRDAPSACFITTFITLS